MIFYEVKVAYGKNAIAEYKKKASEVYLVEGVTCADAEQRVIEETAPYVSGDCEVPSCKRVQFYDLIPVADGEFWYKARVEMITVENEKETRKGQNVYVQANTMLDALHTLKKHLASLDCEVIGLTKTAVVDVIRAVD